MLFRSPTSSAADTRGCVCGFYDGNYLILDPDACIPGVPFSRGPLRTSFFATSPLRECFFRPPKADHLVPCDSACLVVSWLFYSGLSWPVHTSDLVFCYKSPARMFFFDPLSLHFLVLPRIFFAFHRFFLVFSFQYLVFPRIFFVFLRISSYFPRY